MNLQTCIFLGKSGGGKGTQAELLAKYIEKHIKKNDAEHHNIFRLETGNHFREFIKGKTDTSLIAKNIYDTGGLMPDFLAISMWSRDFIERLKKDDHMLLDGSPRTYNEAVTLNTALDFYGRKKRNVLFLDISDEEAHRRLMIRGRTDDSTHEIARRLAWFQEQVMPAINYYKKNEAYHFHHINGQQEIKKVHEDILKALFPGA
jgi:adenylate kinase family enzyme